MLFFCNYIYLHKTSAFEIQDNFSNSMFLQFNKICTNCMHCQLFDVMINFSLESFEMIFPQIYQC